MTSVLDQLYIQNLELGRERLKNAAWNYKIAIQELGKYQSLLADKKISPEGRNVIRKAISIQFSNVNKARAEKIHAIRNLEDLLARKRRAIVRPKRSENSLQRSGSDC